MGCNSSKPNHHTPLNDKNTAANRPVNNTDAYGRPVYNQPNGMHQGEHFEHEAFAEPHLEQIDNGLWRDTQHEIAVHNTKHVQNY